MGPAHGIAVALLERQADPQPLALGLAPQRTDEIDEGVPEGKPVEAVGNERARHGASPSVEAAYLSRAERTAGSNAWLRWVFSFSDTMIALRTAVHWPSPSNRAWPIMHLRACTSISRAHAVARPGKNIWRLKSISSRPTTTRKRGKPLRTTARM